MTDLEINIEIAKHCGLAIVSDGITHNLTPCGPKTEKDPEGCLLKEGPNYCRDLNIMHELESLYIEMDEWWSAYTNHIGQQWSFRHQAHAPARQRAEAFLKNVGKWKS
jgi:hypothetical protein